MINDDTFLRIKKDIIETVSNSKDPKDCFDSLVHACMTLGYIVGDKKVIEFIERVLCRNK